MTRSSRAVLWALVAAILAFSSPASAGCCRIQFDVGPAHFDSGHPLHPVTTEPIKVPGGTVKLPEPGPVPTTPSVQFDKNIPGADMANRTDAAAHAPERAAQNGVDAIGRGIEHLGNEIGMLWAKAKQKAIDEAQGFIDWLIAWLWKHALLGAAALFAAMVAANAIVVYVPKGIATLFRRKRRSRKAIMRHA
jgi:hypothetical protein